MSDIRIEVFPGSYDNGDAYNKVLGYIGQKNLPWRLWLFLYPKFYNHRTIPGQ